MEWFYVINLTRANGSGGTDTRAFHGIYQGSRRRSEVFEDLFTSACKQAGFSPGTTAAALYLEPNQV